ncbi:MAG: hypothetical protein IIA67_10010 [Planctomycetes bacterium]|nr:hypothetical protein [Planctomycetota bacterium]
MAALLLLLLLSLGSSVPVARGQELYSVSPKDQLLRRLDPATGATISSVLITSSVDPFNGVKALAVHPKTHQLWAVLNGFRLVTIDPTTGVAHEVAGIGDTIVGLTFDDAGVLYGIGGPDSNNDIRQTLFVLDQTPFPRTDIFTFPSGGPHTLGFDFESGLLFRASGRLTPRLESLDLDSLALTDIMTPPACAGGHCPEPWQGEPRAMTSDGQGGFFLTSGFRDNEGGEDFLYRLSTFGAPTLIGPLDHRAKGLALVVPEPTALTLFVVGCVILVMSRRAGRGQHSR